MKNNALFFNFNSLLFITRNSRTESRYSKNSTGKNKFSNQTNVCSAFVDGSRNSIALDGNSSNSVKNQIKDWRNREIPNFRTHIDDALQFTPLVATYAFEWCGMKPQTDFKNRTAIMVKSQIFTLGSVLVLKKLTNENRPDGTKYSFPSGHTAEAFAGATLLATEYGKNYKWIPYAAYGTAATVGILRMANNRHYISDVLFGAGLGILSTKIAYWTHQYKWNKTSTSTDPLAVIYLNN